MSEPRKPVGGIPSVIEMLQLMDPASRKKILFNIAQRDPQLAKKIEADLFSFEDLVCLSPMMTQALLREVSQPALLLALRNASDPLKQHLMANMSKRAAGLLCEDLAAQTPKRLADVRAAQDQIMDVAKKLEGEGKLLLKKT